MYLVLQAIFGSWRFAGLALAAVPTALVGGVIVIWARDDAVSLGSILGLLAVLAIAIRSSIMLISRYNQLERAGMPVGEDLISRGAQERITPILMTTLGTALAMTPFAIMGSAPGLEIVHPMSVVIIGGLVTTAIVNLFILPSLYLRIAPSSTHVRASSRRPTMPLSSETAD
jgi:multidrug efflux pump subunit AcrB